MTERTRPGRRLRELPYLEEPERGVFDAWLEATLARHVPPLTWSEMRRGVQALSSLYVERREERDLSREATRGAGKRAALAAYFAPLHYLTAHHAWHELCGDAWGSAARVLDLGCGTGACGAAVARALPGAPRIEAFDRSGFMLGEARHTYRAFGLAARTRRGRLPEVLPRLVEGDVAVLGHFANELDAEAREALVDVLARGVERGTRIFWLEPLAGAAVPWWEPVREELASAGVASAEFKVRPTLPSLLRRMDKAAGLRHDVLGARVLYGPLPGS